MNQATYIQKHPPRDGRNYDAQCARCGSSWDIFTPPNDPDFIRGCLSDYEWCNANPLPGREDQKSMPEWFESKEGLKREQSMATCRSGGWGRFRHPDTLDWG